MHEGVMIPDMTAGDSGAMTGNLRYYNAQGNNNT